VASVAFAAAIIAVVGGLCNFITMPYAASALSQDAAASAMATATSVVAAAANVAATSTTAIVTSDTAAAVAAAAESTNLMESLFLFSFFYFQIL
jgi:hypothetical protein